MITLSSADNALKQVYLEVVSNQLNTNSNPLLAKIEQTTRDVWGKQIVKVAPFGVNGGIGAGDEAGALPSSASNNYVKFVTDLKNLYGKIEISDKAIRASENNVGAFVNLLNAEMEGLIKASQFNFGRMLFGDGSGKLATVSSVSNGVITVDTVKSMIEGLVVDVYSSLGVATLTGARITSVDRVNKTITIDKTFTNEIAQNHFPTAVNTYHFWVTNYCCGRLAPAHRAWLRPTAPRPAGSALAMPGSRPRRAGSRPAPRRTPRTRPRA